MPGPAADDFPPSARDYIYVLSFSLKRYDPISPPRRRRVIILLVAAARDRLRSFFFSAAVPARLNFRSTAAAAAVGFKSDFRYVVAVDAKTHVSKWLHNNPSSPKRRVSRSAAAPSATPCNTPQTRQCSTWRHGPFVSRVCDLKSTAKY